MGVLSEEEIIKLGFSRFGKNLHISDKASFYGIGRISLGDNVRIDDFCVLSAGENGIDIGSYVHVAVGSILIGAGKITLSDFTNISSRVSIYSSNDDYIGGALTGPMVSDEYKDVTHLPVFLGRHVIVGSGSVILPGVRLEDGVAIGALSLVKKNCEAFGIYAGNPVRYIKERSKKVLESEGQFIFSLKQVD